MKHQKLIALIVALSLVFTLCSVVACQKEDKPEKLALDKTSLEMELYEEATLTANKQDVIWATSDSRTVRVKDGKLTSVKLGSATITVSSGEETAQCEVTVVPSTKSRTLTVSEEVVNLKVREEKQIDVKLKENGADLSAEFNWSSDDSDVATVSDGKITGISEGSAVVTVTAEYKGQLLSKTIDVIVANYRQAVLEQVESKTKIPVYDGDVTELGFDEGAKVYKWTTNGTGWDDRIWDTEAVATEYDLFVTEIKFVDTSAAGPLFWSNDTPNTIKFANDFIGEQGTYCFSENKAIIALYDNTTGEEAATWYLQTDRTYTLVVNMSENSWYPYAIGVFKAVDIYLANPSFCSKAYARNNFSKVNWPKEKVKDGISFGQSDASQAINSISAEFTSDAGYDKMYKFNLMASGEKWAKRLQVMNKKVTTEFNIKAAYSDYEYFGFSVAFEDVSKLESVTPINIWTGDYAVFINAEGVMSAGGGATLESGIVRLFKDGVDVTGQPLQSGVIYDLRVQIRTANDAYGFAVSGDSTSSFYIGIPYFM